jgi:hypothetical protein
VGQFDNGTPSIARPVPENGGFHAEQCSALHKLTNLCLDAGDDPATTQRQMKAVSAKKFAARAAGFAGALILVAGCGQHAVKLTAEQSKAFDSAPAEVKQTWAKALAADKANDFETAAASLDSLKKMILSEPQTQALDAERAAFGERLIKAAENNDPAAVRAVQNSQKSKAR